MSNANTEVQLGRLSDQMEVVCDRTARIERELIGTIGDPASRAVSLAGRVETLEEKEADRTRREAAAAGEVTKRRDWLWGLGGTAAGALVVGFIEWIRTQIATGGGSP